MTTAIGQIVQFVKDNVSHDRTYCPTYNTSMTIWSAELEFNESLLKRVHTLRNERGYTAEQMAIALGIPPERYRKYETRTPLPQYLIERFAIIVDRDVEYILTGKSSRPPRKPSAAANANRNGTNG